ALVGILSKSNTLMRVTSYTLHNYRYSLKLDTIGMLVGGLYWLCIDYDGPGYRFVGPSGYKVYVSPVPDEYIGAVPTQSSTSITFTCNGCTANTYAYLTRQRGDEPTGCHDTRTGTSRPRVDNTGNENNAPSLITQVGTTNKWTLAFDASPFYQGEL
ncbi:unnamed protein product, partial [Amoebophrya sp. A25]